LPIVSLLKFLGSLGYGYSHQLYGLNDKSPQERVQDSIFFRLPGLDSRNGCDDCLLPCHIGRPALMDGVNSADVEIGSPIVRAQLWNLSEDSACFLTENTEQCVYLTRLINKRGRLPRLKEELKTKPHRHERIEFLKQHVLRDTSKNTGSGTRSSDDHNDHIPDLQRRKSEAVKTMLENVTPLIEISDGINTRQSRRGRGARNFNQQELDNANFAHGSGSNHADMLGVDNTGGPRRNISTISNTGFFDTNYGLMNENSDEDDDEEKRHTSDTVRQGRNTLTVFADTMKSWFRWGPAKARRTEAFRENESDEYSD